MNPTPTPTNPTNPNPTTADTSALGLHRYVFEPGDLARALVLLHGTGGDERDLIPLGRKVAPGAAFLSPRGNVSEAGALRFFRRLAEGVFDLADVRNRSRDLAAWLKSAQAQHGMPWLDGLGFSNGANILAATLLTQGPVIRRAVLLRAMVTVDPNPGLPANHLAGVKVLLVSGERDPILPLANARKLAAQLTAAGAEVRHEVLKAGHELTGIDLVLASEFLG